MASMTTPQHKNPCPGDHKMEKKNSVPFLGPHYCTLSLSDLFLGEKKIFKEIMLFHYITCMVTPLPRGHEIQKFGRPFLTHHNYALSFSESCPRVQKTILKAIMQFHYLTLMATPWQRAPAPGVIKFTILVDLSLVIITIYLLSVLCLGEEKKTFKEIMHFHYVTYMATPYEEPLPRGS